MHAVHATRHLDLDADCVEFCPSSSLRDVLAVGTYTLDEATQNRIGRLYLYQVVSSSTGQPDLLQANTVDTAAIFDLKWAPFGCSEGNTLLAEAAANGTVELYEVARQLDVSQGALPDTPDVTLKPVQKVNCGSGGLCTSVDWSHPDWSTGKLLATSTSSSDLLVLDCDAPGGATVVLEHANAHDLEIWMVTFDRCRSHFLYSGADDCFFKGWDMRAAGSPDGHALEASFANRRAHSAGVCCIVPSPWEEYSVVTGSYDDHVRFWDIRNVSRPVVSAELNAGGGVWRLKWHPSLRGVLGVACMYNGFALLEGGLSGHEFRVFEEYTEHSSLAYGISWYHGEPGSKFERESALSGNAEADELECIGGGSHCGQSLVATCSFYDRSLHLWSPRMLCCL